jgi:acetyl esterase/lipase
MLDDRSVTVSSRAVTDGRVWNRTCNLIGWRYYLGDAAGTDGASPYAAPTRAQDLTGLPPAFISVGELDLFLDEDIEYGQRLLQAGVPTELHVYAGAYHGSDLLSPGAALSRRMIRDRDEALQRAFSQGTVRAVEA